MAESAFEQRVHAIGSEMLRRAAKVQADRGLAAQQEVLLTKLLADDDLRTRMLRFVDVLPALHDDEAMVDHLRAYLGDDLPRLPVPVVGRFTKQINWGLKHSRHGLSAKVAAGATRAAVGQLARRFIAGKNPARVVKNLERMHRRGMGFTLDVLGEATVSEAEADAFAKRYRALIDDLTPRVQGWERREPLATISGREAPVMNLSVKVSSLYSQLDPVDPVGSAAAIKARLRPLLVQARAKGAQVTLDMESYDTKDVTLRVFQELLDEAELRDWPDAGIAMQAYLRDTEGDVDRMIEWATARGTPVRVRLVRGAYWDYETVIAKQHHWAVPVWERKPQTDACYERCLRKLMGAYPAVETAVATHNVRSQAFALALAEELGLSPTQYEFQMLYGMADSVKQVLVEMGQRVRVYVPFGELLPGMAYLVRRLLENTSSQSFVRMSVGDDRPAAELLAAPIGTEIAEDDVTTKIERRDEAAARTASPLAYRPEPVRRFVKSAERVAMTRAIERVRGELGRTYPLWIGGAERAVDAVFDSINPCRPGEVVGRCHDGSAADADYAVAVAGEAADAWRARSVTERAGVLRGAAELMRERRAELAAWMVLEAGKPWREADADVAEAISFCDYYAQQAQVQLVEHNFDAPGETNRYWYEPRGVTAVISPWNFPLAIPTGMVTAALVTGNPVVFKPAPQTPVIGWQMCELLHEAGVPRDVLTWLPGGDEPGKALVAHKGVHMIVFTGSEAAGRAIIKAAAEVHEGQHHIKQVVAEMGGKNAVIIDSDADVDDAVSGVIKSAFGYAGQKCSAASRVIVVGELYDAMLDRLIEAASSLAVGSAEDAGTFVPAVIDAEAMERIRGFIDRASERHQHVFERVVRNETGGYFVGPTVVADVSPGDELAQQEVFGPVLAVMRAASFEEAIEIANGTKYALTGGVYSRHPGHLRVARERLAMGNVYLNRTITGAVVGRQPFGGFKLSGVGSKAGGPDYLKQFVEPRTVTENTIRRGFAPEAGAPPAAGTAGE